MEKNEQLLALADELKPELFHRNITRTGKGQALKCGDAEVFDFGEHLTGTICLDLSTCGKHPDAPVRLAIKFAENQCEFEENPEDYHGWLSSSWIQHETIHIDTIPCRYSLPRRYAFRYIRVEVTGISDRYSLLIQSVSCCASTSADDSILSPVNTGDQELDAIDSAACITLRECMQDVFEDGPKRDRRLWLGDLRLQALAESVTYKNFDLIKRCLCMFAGMPLENGLLPACVFTEPEYEADDTINLDYSLMFIPALLDYYEATGDVDFIRLMWPAAKRQLELASAYYDESGRLKEPEPPARWFIDWNLSLDRTASAYGVHLYCLRSGIRLAGILDDKPAEAQYREEFERRRLTASEILFDKELGLFISGEEKQISMASQIWAVLGGICCDAAIFDRAKATDVLPIVSPYLYHYYVEALLRLGEEEKAFDVIRFYWGGMLKNGADTFWELYNPENPFESPYGGTIVNSYCHAWSCTPSYFIRKKYNTNSQKHSEKK